MTMLSSTKNFGVSVFSGLLMAAAWYGHLGILIFFAWVPLLLIEEQLHSPLHQGKTKLKFFGYTYCTFFIWNILVTWWIVYASFGGACMAILANSLLMTVVFLVYSKIKRSIQKKWAIWLLIPIWLAWEYGHGIWDLSWTWLNLGNVFAFHHRWVQWYEFTGSSGGSAWVLAVNIFAFQIIRNYDHIKLLSPPIFKLMAWILFPILISYGIYYVRTPLSESKKGLKTLVVQPNIDPYNFKFVMEYREQFFKFLNLVKGKVNQKTRYLVLPETFITDNLNEAQINQSEQIREFRDSLLQKFPELKIVCGANTFVFYENEKDVTATARKDMSSGKSYDVFNTAMYIDENNVQLYHKSKLVPGVERMPFPALFKPLEKWALDLGGTIGSLGLQDQRAVFSDTVNGVHIAPVVCYESVYSDYVADYVREGADVIFIVTNDGWWDDTPGYYQHMNYARLRAIENRRQIARCANTGTSCFIDEFGNSSQNTGWWVEATIEGNVYTNNQLTFFSRFGDLFSRLSIGITLIVLFWFGLLKVMKRG